MICNTCNIEKPLSDFPKSPGTKLGVRKKCKVCYAQYMREYYKNNPKQYIKHKGFVARNDKEYKRQWSRHGLTEERFRSLCSRYDGKCWSCKTRPANCIDHDHACCSGPYSCGDCVRGVLCHWCNSVLGHANDNIQTLKACIEYLSS